MSIAKRKLDPFLIKLVSVFVLTIPLSQYISTKLLIILLIFSFFVKHDWRRVVSNSWDIIFFISILMLGLLYSANLGAGFKVLETNFSFVAISIIFLAKTDFSEKKAIAISNYFTLGISIACALCFVNASFNFYQDRDVSVFLFENLTGIINSQPTYFAYYLIFAITFGLHRLYFNEIKNKKGFIVAAIIFFFIILMLTSGSTAFVSILLVLAFFILKFLTEPAKSSYKIIVFGLSIFFLGSMFYVSYFDLNSFQGSNYWERFVLWDAAINATPNLLIGVGTGDYTSVLNDYYRSHNLSQFSVSNYNAHNQFIQTLLSNGILGLVALLIMLIRPLVLSIRYQNPLGILVFFSFFIYGLTEVFLGRYQGVVFFALMHQTFIAHYHSQGKALAIKES